MGIKGEMSLLGFGSRLNKDRKNLLLKIIVFLPLLMIFFILFYGYNSVLIDEEMYQNGIKSTYNGRSILLTTIISENFQKAKIQTHNVKEAIVKDLQIAYGDDKTRMKEDYDSKNPNTPFYQILSKHIDNKFINKVKDENRMFIANKYGVLIDNSLKYHSNSSKKWEEIFDDATYRKLVKQTIQHISNKEDSAILWVDSNASMDIKFDDHGESKTDSLALEFISKCVNSEKFDEIGKYSIIGVSYIFNHNDIFGVPDVEVGQRVENDKIYVIQVLSIKDMLEYDPAIVKALATYDNILKDQTAATSNMLFYKTVTIALIAGFAALTFLGVWYLAEFYSYILGGNRIEDFK